MKSFLATWWKVFPGKVFVLLFTTVFGWKSAAHLVNLDSDLAVFAGTLLFLVLATVWFAVIKWAITALDESSRNHYTVVVALACAAALSVSACTRVEPGKVGIEVNQWGSDRGVQDYTIKTGMVTYNPITSTVFEYPVFTQTAKWEGDEAIQFNSKEGLVFTAAVSLSYNLVADKVPAFYVKFRSDDINQFTHGFLRNVARDAFNEIAAGYTAEEVYGDKKEELLTRARMKINHEVETYGVHLEQFGFLGAPNPPATVKTSIEAKTKAIQDAIRVENEVRQARAEAEKSVATAEGAARARIATARGEAEANRLLTASITPILLEWEKLKVTGQAVGKWNGQRPQVEGAGAGLLLQVK